VAAIAAGVGTLSAATIGVSSAVVSSEHSGDARRLSSEESRFRRKVSVLESDIYNLRYDISRLEISKNDCERATQAISALEKQCELLHDQMDLFLGELNVARTYISDGVNKTQAIASALHGCEYARTRSDFVKRVKGALMDLGNGAGNTIGASNDTINSLENQLVPLQKNQGKVANILEKAFRM
jgi:chromosome segregation ATPase